MPARRISACVISLLCVLAAAPASSRTLDMAAVERIDAFVAKAIKQEGMPPGLAVAIVQNDKVLLARGYGVRQVGKPAPVTADTAFELGSVSKLFTITALGRAADDGKLRWDDPVTRHIPEYRVADARDSATFTIADLATHRTGYNGIAVSPPTLAVGQERFRYQTATKPFRIGFAYSNEQYAALGIVIERAAGTPVRDYMRARLLAPLAMSNTILDSSNTFRTKLPQTDDMVDLSRPVLGLEALRPGADVAIGHWTPAGASGWLAGGYADGSFQFGAAGVLSSANDVAKFMNFLLRPPGGSASEVPQPSPELHAALFRPAFLYPAPGEPDGYVIRTLGLRLGEVAGGPSYRIVGSWGGFMSVLRLVPAEKFGVVVLQNGRERPQANVYLKQLFEAVEKQVLAELEGREIADPVATMQADDALLRAAAVEARAYRLAPADNPLQKPDIRARYGAKLDIFDLPDRMPATDQPLGQFEGRFASRLYGSARLATKNGQLWVTAPEWDHGSALVAWDSDRFQYSRELHPSALHGLLTFIRDSRGRIEGFRLFDDMFVRQPD